MRTLHASTRIWVLLFCATALAALPSVAAAVEVRRITLPTRDLVTDPVRQRIYASVPGTSSAFGNSIVRLDPTTGKVEASVFVGSEPKAIAIDANATVLYVGLNGTGRIARVNLATFMPDLEFAIDSVAGAFLAENIAVMPGNPETIAVERRFYQYEQDAGVAIYDHGVRRPHVTSTTLGFAIRSMLFSDDPSRLYATSDYGAGILTFTVDAMGATFAGIWEDFPPTSGGDIEYAGGVVYTTSGLALVPESQTLAGTFSGVSYAIVEPDVATNRVFFLTQNQLDVFDRTTFVRLSSTMLPGLGDLYYNRADLIRWGADGVAFRTDDELVLVDLSRSNADPCADVPHCDPATGACTRQPFFNGAFCDDENLCTTGESCQSGVCRGGTALDCNDFNPCTIDACDPSGGCTHTAVTGSCWGIAGRATASACAPSGCQTQRTNVSGTLFFGDDGTYTVPTSRVCDATQKRFPDEKGTSKPGRKGWLVLRQTNVDEIIIALKACPSISRLARQIEIQTLRHLRQRIMIPTTGGTFCRWSPGLADGSHLCGIQRSHGTVVVRGTSVGFSIVARFGGTRLDGGLTAVAEAPPALGGE
jgi:hypothetical protein